MAELLTLSNQDQNPPIDPSLSQAERDRLSGPGHYNRQEIDQILRATIQLGVTISIDQAYDVISSICAEYKEDADKDKRQELVDQLFLNGSIDENGIVFRPFEDLEDPADLTEEEQLEDRLEILMTELARLQVLDSRGPKLNKNLRAEIEAKKRQLADASLELLGVYAIADGIDPNNVAQMRFYASQANLEAGEVFEEIKRRMEAYILEFGDESDSRFVSNYRSLTNRVLPKRRAINKLIGDRAPSYADSSWFNADKRQQLSRRFNEATTVEEVASAYLKVSEGLSYSEKAQDILEDISKTGKRVGVGIVAVTSAVATESFKGAKKFGELGSRITIETVKVGKSIGLGVVAVSGTVVTKGFNGAKRFLELGARGAVESFKMAKKARSEVAAVTSAAGREGVIGVKKLAAATSSLKGRLTSQSPEADTAIDDTEPEQIEPENTKTQALEINVTQDNITNPHQAIKLIGERDPHVEIDELSPEDIDWVYSQTQTNWYNLPGIVNINGNVKFNDGETIVIPPELIDAVTQRLTERIIQNGLATI